MRTVLRNAACVITALVIVLTACDSKEQHSSQTQNNQQGDRFSWVTDSSGAFTTNNIERAQEETPFRIIIPSYLPSGFFTDPLLRGSLKGVVPEDNVSILLNYKTKEAYGGMILIVEQSMTMLPPDPSLNPECMMIEIAGIETVECESKLPLPKPDGTAGFEFYWNQDGIFLIVSIYGYDHGESVKIVESMIQHGD